jgi:hypothetical protein
VTRIAFEAKSQVRFVAVGKRLLLAVQRGGQQQQSGKSKSHGRHFGVA